MSLKNTIALLAVTLLMVLFGNCAPVDDSADLSSEELIVSCNLIFKPTFLSTYYGFAQRNECNGCHGVGISHQFSIADQDAAFSNFQLAGDATAPEGQVVNARTRFYTNSIVEPGHQNVGKASHIPEMDSFEAAWVQAEAEFNECMGN